MATAPKTTKPVGKQTTVATKKATPSASSATKKTAPTKTAVPAVKPVKETFTKVGLINHLAEQSGVEAKSVKAVMAALEGTILGAASKKGVGEFMLSGLLKISTQKIPAKKKRVGINPFTGLEQEFAAKPASIRVKIRAMKKLKDAAL